MTQPTAEQKAQWEKEADAGASTAYGSASANYFAGYLAARQKAFKEYSKQLEEIRAIDPKKLRHLAAWLTLAEEKIHVNNPEEKSSQDTLREYADIIEKIQNP